MKMKLAAYHRLPWPTGRPSDAHYITYGLRGPSVVLSFVQPDHTIRCFMHTCLQGGPPKKKGPAGDLLMQKVQRRYKTAPPCWRCMQLICASCTTTSRATILIKCAFCKHLNSVVLKLVSAVLFSDNLNIRMHINLRIPSVENHFCDFINQLIFLPS